MPKKKTLKKMNAEILDIEARLQQVGRSLDEWAMLIESCNQPMNQHNLAKMAKLFSRDLQLTAAQIKVAFLQAGLPFER